MEVRLLGYQNPTQTRFRDSGERRCCDGGDSSGCTEGFRRCDSRFTYCLRAFGNQSSQEGGCSDPNERMRSGPNWDDGSINFTQDKVLGLDNPFHLQGLSNNYTVSCLVLLVFWG